MSEEKVVNILNSIGLSNNRSISDEDYSVYADYFEDRLLSSDSESEVEKTPEEDNIVNVSDSSLLKNIPNLDELSEGNLDHLINIDDVIIEIEESGNNQEVVDEDDGKMKHKVTSFSDTEFVVKFLQNYAEQHAIMLPGRSSTVYNTTLKLLPSSDSKVKIYETYKASFTNEITQKPVHSRVFSNIWRDICPDIVVMKPRTDLCAICQKHYSSGAEMALVPEEKKIETIEMMRTHLQTVSKERKFYNETIQETRIKFQNQDKSAVHYSFDMAQ
ncbi:hypothetical protein J6590_042825 [Homalodisca vitripennis]|nr:hypothetical protein J6590_042825 [Homalodisca vitripennis]